MSSNGKLPESLIFLRFLKSEILIKLFAFNGKSSAGRSTGKSSLVDSKHNVFKDPACFNNCITISLENRGDERLIDFKDNCLSSTCKKIIITINHIIFYILYK